MGKLKKIAKVWVFIALFMLVSSFVVENVSQNFYITFIAFFVVSGIFILFGWDKHITYGDDPLSGNTRTYEEDADDWLEN